MGLDMYLSASKYLWDVRGEDKAIAEAIASAVDNPNLKGVETKSIDYSVGYWRKANAIHHWFVENCQGGIDDCRQAWISEDSLNELLSICKNVLLLKEKLPGSKDEIISLLPTCEGFFFGSTDIDDEYFKDVESTVHIVEKALVLCGEGLDIYYQSSW